MFGGAFQSHAADASTSNLEGIPMNLKLSGLFVGLLLWTAATFAGEIEFSTKTIDEQPVLSMRFTVAPTAISQKLGSVLPRIFMYAQQNGIEMAGQPFSRYHGMDGGKLEMEAGIPVKEKAKGEGDIVAGALPAGRVVTGTHLGPYEKLGASHEAMKAWAADKQETANGAPWECYVTDPMTEPDSSKWKTELFLPVAAQE
jgi:effector-binding domain-containing protein